MKNITKLFINLSVVLLVSCSSTSPLNEFKQLRNPEELNHSFNYQMSQEKGYKEFVTKLQSFSAKVTEAYKNSEYQDNNIVISPASLELCLGLAVRCANNKTRQELLEAFDLDYTTFNKYYKYYYNSIVTQPGKENKSYISLSNSMWFDNNLPLIDEGLDGLRDDYYCYSYEVDFDKKNQKTNEAMKEFVKKQTNGLINPNFQFSLETIFVLMNTLYIKDTWGLNIQSIPYTDQYKFTNIDGTISNKQLLKGETTDGKAMKKDSFTAFYEPLYQTCLYFIKPEPGHTIKEVFNKENIEYIIDRQNYIYQDDTLLERYHTNCVFPEFTVDADIDLINMMINTFNIKSLFDNTCDISNITSANGYCDEIKQMVKLIVNNQGIEGAALTYMNYAGAAGPDEYVDVYQTYVVDKEFGFVLTRNNAILFSGIISNIDK